MLKLFMRNLRHSLDNPSQNQKDLRQNYCKLRQNYCELRRINYHKLRKKVLEARPQGLMLLNFFTTVIYNCRNKVEHFFLSS
jgi:hypothetical protein